MQNLNLLFLKEYYRDICPSFSEEALKPHNEALFRATFRHDRDYSKWWAVEPAEKALPAAKRLVMKTSYPGLLCGIGNPHGSGLNAEDINVGFSFDYVTGQPYLPGSTVKGMLRSHFKDHPAAVAEILKRDVAMVERLETEIFEGDDVFCDAVIFDGDETGRLIGKDYITPHGEPTQEPTPIFILKILPEVRLEFRFLLHDGELPADEKRGLFQSLLELFGIGAKTNVGYGRLTKAEERIFPKREPLQRAQPNAQRHQSNVRQQTPSHAAPSRRGGTEYIRCPHCGKMSYKYYQNSTNLRRNCSVCKVDF